MAEIQRRKTGTVKIGQVRVGWAVPVVVQSMTNTDTADIAGTIEQVAALALAGSEIVRVTVNNEAAAAAVPAIVEGLDKRGIRVPIVGDFHYNGHLLLKQFPETARTLAKYRINPGNASIGNKAAQILVERHAHQVHRRQSIGQWRRVFRHFRVHVLHKRAWVAGRMVGQHSVLSLHLKYVEVISAEAIKARVSANCSYVGIDGRHCEGIHNVRVRIRGAGKAHLNVSLAFAVRVVAQLYRLPAGGLNAQRTLLWQVQHGGEACFTAIHQSQQRGVGLLWIKAKRQRRCSGALPIHALHPE